jgi:hypothetical protein
LYYNRYDVGTGKATTMTTTTTTRIIEVGREEWLSALLVAMWKQVGIRDMEDN